MQQHIVLVGETTVTEKLEGFFQKRLLMQVLDGVEETTRGTQLCPLGKRALKIIAKKNVGKAVKFLQMEEGFDGDIESLIPELEETVQAAQQQLAQDVLIETSLEEPDALSDDTLLVLADGKQNGPLSTGEKDYLLWQKFEHGHSFATAIRPEVVDQRGKSFVGDIITQKDFRPMMTLRRNVIVEVPDTFDGRTSLEREVEFFNQIIEHRIASGNVLRGDDQVDRVVSVLMGLIPDDVRPSFTSINEEELYKTVSYFVENQLPILITLAVFVGRVNNQLKFLDDHAEHGPHYGWLMFIAECKLISEKVKAWAGYEPGVELVIMEEGHLFDELLGVDRDVQAQHVRDVELMIKMLSAPVRIMPLKSEDFPEDVVAANPVTHVPDVEVHSMLCSLPEMNNQLVIDPLYRSRERDYKDLRAIAGEELWQSAQRKRLLVNRTLGIRKGTRLFQLMTGREQIVDGCFIKKPGRLTLTFTSGSSMPHGMPVVEREGRGNGFHSLQIVPEYRIRDEFKEAKPVYAHIGGKDITFYYKKN